MTEKAIERYAVTNLVDAYWPDPSSSWMRYDAELVRDAMRYRWLREQGARDGVIDWSALGVGYQQVAEMDAAIDAALRARAESEAGHG